jgi:hypothetical protein
MAKKIDIGKVSAKVLHMFRDRERFTEAAFIRAANQHTTHSDRVLEYVLTEAWVVLYCVRGGVKIYTKVC